MFSTKSVNIYPSSPTFITVTKILPLIMNTFLKYVALPLLSIIPSSLLFLVSLFLNCLISLASSDNFLTNGWLACNCSTWEHLGVSIESQNWSKHLGSRTQLKWSHRIRLAVTVFRLSLLIWSTLCLLLMKFFISFFFFTNCCFLEKR